MLKGHITVIGTKYLYNVIGVAILKVVYTTEKFLGKP